MLRSVRKFSSSPYAKIFLAIVILPFIFWGMGPVFQDGNQNTIVTIGKNKISKEEFINYVKYNSQISEEEMLNENLMQELLYNFVGIKLMNMEIENFDIQLSENALSKIIKNEKIFKKKNEFSRIEYEKFLLNNGLKANAFEANMSNQIKREHLFELIKGGVSPSHFLVNTTYDNINQKRNIEFINLKNILENKTNFSEDKIVAFFNENKETFKDIYKTIEFYELNPKILTGDEEFSNLFFEKIDEIDDLIIEGKSINFILKKFNLGDASQITFNNAGLNKNSEYINIIPNELRTKVFNVDANEKTILFEHKDKFLILEVVNTENIQKTLESISVKNEILENLKKVNKRKLISDLINKINKNEFNKLDFYKFSKDKNISIKKMKIKNKNDHSNFKSEIVDQIYMYPSNNVIVVADIGLNEIYLIYIEKIENSNISKNSKDYNEYINLSKNSIIKDISNTYDSYLQKKYEININQKVFKNIISYF